MDRRGSSPEILGEPGPRASSCHHKHYVGDKNGETFKNLGAQPQGGGGRALLAPA